jgi:hypothetical protein
LRFLAEGDCVTPEFPDASYVSRRKVDEAVVRHFLNRHFDEEATRARLRRAADEKIDEARTLAEQADRAEAEAAVALARVRTDYVAGAISADDWNSLGAELDEAQTASWAQAELLRAQAVQIEAEAAQVDVDAELLERLGEIVRAVAGRGDGDVAALRAALQATFEAIILQTEIADAPRQIWHDDLVLVPVVRSDLLGQTAIALDEKSLQMARSGDAAEKASHAVD